MNIEYNKCRPTYNRGLHANKNVKNYTISPVVVVFC